MGIGAMAVLSVFSPAERLLPPGPWLAKLPGVALVAAAASVAWRERVSPCV